MCTGLEVMALASLAGGSYLQYDATQDSIDATNDAAKAEAMRQSAIDKQKAQNFTEALKLAQRDTQEQTLEKAIEERRELMEGAATVPQSEAAYQSPAASDQPRIVREHAERKRDQAQDFVSLLGDARARLGAWGESMYDFGDKLGDYAWTTDELNRQAGRSAQIGLQEAQLAGQTAGRDKALMGNILSTVGTAAAGPLAYKRALAKAPASVITPDMFDVVGPSTGYYIPAMG